MFVSAASVLLLAAQLGCGKSPSGPTPPVPVLALSCPANVVASNVPSVPAPVTYAAPIPSGGVAPINVTCSVPSGGNFEAGATAVTCTALDSASPQARATCGFTVTVTQTFEVSATRFLAFGDSITEGEVEYNDGVSSFLAIEPDKAYPTVLGKLMAERYSQQDIRVLNAGFRGEPASCTAGSTFCGANRISRAIEDSRPNVLLLLQGVVDLSAGRGEAAIAPMVDALKYMIRDARRRGVEHVFVGTLLPQKQGQRDWAMEYIEPANYEIRHLVAAEGVHLVDVHAGMLGQEATLIGKDGLHPTPEGYEKLAGIFFDAIRERLETVVTTPEGPQRVLQVLPLSPHVEVGPQSHRPSVRIR